MRTRRIASGLRQCARNGDGAGEHESGITVGVTCDVPQHVGAREGLSVGRMTSPALRETT